MVKNPPANSGDTGSIPGPGRFHRPHGNLARAPQHLNPSAVEPMLCNKRSHGSEKPRYHNWRVVPLAATRESPCTATKTQDSQKINTHINYPKFFILKNKENTTRVTGYEHICYKLAGTSDFSGLTHFIRRATPSSKMVIENALSPYERPVWKLMENGVGRGSWDQVRSRGLSPATHRPRTQPLPSFGAAAPLALLLRALLVSVLIAKFL